MQLFNLVVHFHSFTRRLTMTKDYSIKVIDSTGRKLTVSINGDSIDELIRIYGDYWKEIRIDGEEYARTQVESEAVERAIRNGEIGPEVYLDESV
jgi:hypothetical protein